MLSKTQKFIPLNQSRYDTNKFKGAHIIKIAQNDVYIKKI